MAARVLFQRRSLAPLASLAIGGLALAPATAFAEAPEDFKRKPIYDDAESTPTSNPGASWTSPFFTSETAEDDEPKQKGPTPTDRLAVHIGKARLFIYQQAVGAEDAVNRTMDSAFDLEQSFTGTIASLAPPRESGEQLMPGTIYVLVAAMAGSIITRNRNILLRASAPVALGILAANTVLPITTKNVSELVWNYEKKFPVLADSHIKAQEGVQKSVSFVKAHGVVGARYVDDKVTEARETVEGWVKQGK